MATINKRRRKSGKLAYTAQIRITINGKVHTEAKTHTDIKWLEKWAEDREAELREGGEAAALLNPTIGQVLQYYLKDFPPAGRTKKDHINFLINHSVSRLDAVKLTPAQLIRHARQRREEGAGPATVLNDFIWLRICFRSVRLSRDLPLNLQAVEDAAYILRKERVIAKPKQRDRRPSIDELSRLLEYFSDRDGRAELPMADIVLFAIFSGRRQEEITRISYEDLDRDRGGVLVREMKHPREKKDTFCHLTPEALLIIDRQSTKKGRIFPYNSKSISAAFTRACSFLEIPDLHFHDLRRECTSWLFELGWEIQRVSQVTGHKSWSSLQIYVHLRDRGTKDKFLNWPWRPLCHPAPTDPDSV